MQWVDVATFSEWDKANVFLRRLMEAGLHAKIHDESKFQKYWCLSEPVGSLRIEVAKGEEFPARQLIQKWDASDGPSCAAIHCPQCHSTRVEFPQFTRKFFTISILPILLTRLLRQQRFYCEDCHFTWLKRKTPHI